ncbi:hypothetical protein E2C01_037139 [Portunus trituberculatus]|uniref:Uncharacterized protein n=1 Tax=Portunus trituberculatus TaxID=210409 RepID=A0A5B7F7C0_PORTR|nr:hypothetical protein [Portunus trituberculatus]
MSPHREQVDVVKERKNKEEEEEEEEEEEKEKEEKGEGGRCINTLQSLDARNHHLSTVQQANNICHPDLHLNTSLSCGRQVNETRNHGRRQQVHTQASTVVTVTLHS